jgi:hypothetical protein
VQIPLVIYEHVHFCSTLIIQIIYHIVQLATLYGVYFCHKRYKLICINLFPFAVAGKANASKGIDGPLGYVDRATILPYKILSPSLYSFISFKGSYHAPTVSNDVLLLY